MAESLVARLQPTGRLASPSVEPSWTTSMRCRQWRVRSVGSSSRVRDSACVPRSAAPRGAGALLLAWRLPGSDCGAHPCPCRQRVGADASKTGLFGPLSLLDLARTQIPGRDSADPRPSGPAAPPTPMACIAWLETAHLFSVHLFGPNDANQPSTTDLRTAGPPKDPPASRFACEL